MSIMDSASEFHHLQCGYLTECSDAIGEVLSKLKGMALEPENKSRMEAVTAHLEEARRGIIAELADSRKAFKDMES